MQRMTLGVGALLATILFTSVATAQNRDTRLSRKDANFICTALVKVERGLEKADQLQGNLGPDTPFKQLAKKENSYLPAGFPQVNPGHDTCRVAGVGHYFDTNDVKQFNDCDPQGPRRFMVTCERNQPIRAEFCENRGRDGSNCPQTGRGATGGRDGGAQSAAAQPFDPRTTRPCEGDYRGARVFSGGRGDRTRQEFYMSPSCDKRLSNFKMDGYFLACDDTSVTYATCKQRLSGSWSHQDKSSTGSFCALPQGERVIDQLSKYNAKKFKELQAGADKMATNLADAKQKLMKKVREHQIECDQRGRAISHL